VVGADDAVEGHFAANHSLEHGFGAIGHEFGVHAALSFEDAEDDRLATGAAAGLALDASGSEVAFVHFDRAAERAVGLASRQHPASQGVQKTIDGVAVHAGELRDLNGGEVGGGVSQKASENGLRNSSAHEITIFHGKTSVE